MAVDVSGAHPALPEGARLVRSSGTMLHRQLFMVLREQIMRGVYPPGAALPNEEELCGHFGVSRITVRRALSDLKQQGLVERFQGRGTFVSARLAASPPFQAESFVDAMKRAGRETQVRVLAVRTALPPVSVALQLHVRSGEQAVYAARHEMARTLDDLLCRRTRARLEDRVATLAAAPAAAALLAAELGWTDEETMSQVATFVAASIAEERM